MRERWVERWREEGRAREEATEGRREGGRLRRILSKRGSSMWFCRKICSLANPFVINLGQKILGTVVRVVGDKGESPGVEPQGARDVTYSQPV